MGITAIIPARGGSKGIPRKNIKPLCGRPLIGWTIEAARESGVFERIIVSTDDEEIAEVALIYGAEVPFLRPEHLASDEATSVDTVIHSLEHIASIEHVILLQPTSPLRTVHDIKNFAEFCLARGVRSAVSVCKLKAGLQMLYSVSEGCLMKPLEPHKNHAKHVKKVTRRQDMQKIYAPNGALYWLNSESFLEDRAFITDATLAFEMPLSRSLDLDTSDDWQVAEFLFSSYRDREGC